MKFKLEYFGNDPIVNELFYNNQNRNVNIVELLQNINSNNVNERQIMNSQNAYQRTNNRNRNTSHNNQNNVFDGKEVLCGLFLINFKPSKTNCIFIFLLNLIICGLGTILLGLNKKSIFYTLFGLIQCFGFCYFYIYSSSLQNSKALLFGRQPANFIHIYFKILILLLYLSSIYVGIFRNFLFFNPRRIKFNEKREKGILVFFMNILVCGLGTFFVGIIRLTQQGNFCFKSKYIFNGIIQLFGYLLILYGLSLIPKNSKVEMGFLFLAGGLCFCFSIYSSYKYYKKVIS